VLEKHCTLDPNGDKPDDRMALTPRQMRIYTDLADVCATLCSAVSGDPERAARIGARRSAFAVRSLPEGYRLVEDDVAWLRPGGGIGAEYQLAGRTLTTAIEAGEQIDPGDLV